jgi:hypothetical protein
MGKIITITYKNINGKTTNRRYVTFFDTIEQALLEMQVVAENLVIKYGGEIISIQEEK